MTDMTDMTVPSRRLVNPTPPPRPGAGRLPGPPRLPGAAALLAACAGSPPPPSSGPPGREPSAPDPRLQPPPFAATAPVPPAAREDRRTAERREILDAAWRTVRDKHYDPKLGGLDWEAVRRR